jgi:2-oxoglutarate ferredoxin oxidoreductase subunit alpha
VAEFIARHDRVYVAEQNRDGQMESLLCQELPGELADRLRSIRHFNGVPIDAEAISDPLLAGELAQRQPTDHQAVDSHRVPVA